MARFQRQRVEGEQQRATNLELFYDLAFVFAITQISHLLLDDLSFRGAWHAGLVLLVVWWAWNYTTWATNELDPESVAVRLLLMAITLASLLLAVAIPGAFSDRALLFAGSYVVIQIGRGCFLTYASALRGTVERERSLLIVIWFAVAGVPWILGALVDGAARPALWLLAVTIDYIGPLLVYRVPGRPRLDGSTWQVESSHFAERFQLFIIIALGESIAVTGATASGLHMELTRLTSFALAFLASASMWWLYFSYVARIAERRLELATDRTRVARDAYTYLHVVMVAGVIVSAVGNEIVIAHPHEHLEGFKLAVVCAGPAIYLLAHSLFRLRLAGSLSPKRTTGAVLCILAGLTGMWVSALAVAALVTAVITGVVAAEEIASWRRHRRGDPDPLARLEARLASHDA